EEGEGEGEGGPDAAAPRRRARVRARPPRAAHPGGVPLRLQSLARAVVDGHRLLRTEDLLPLSVGGIFPGLWGWGFPPLSSSHPSSSSSSTRRPAIRDDLGYLEGARNVTSWL
ncbi:unnamed protein product, partial [Urochloa humidicola]